jgi:hypothetical protein
MIVFMRSETSDPLARPERDRSVILMRVVRAWPGAR